MYQNHLAAHGGKPSQPLRLGIFRNDFMLHHGTEPLQVEMNTISSGFGVLSARVHELHHIWQRLGYTASKGVVSPSPAGHLIAQTMASAHRAVSDSSHMPDAEFPRLPAAVNPVVLFVVQGRETNEIDQRGLELHLAKAGVPCVRATLSEISAHGKLDEQNVLWYPCAEVGSSVPQPRPVSLVYYRAGYTPNDYHGQAEWDARVMMEDSIAVKVRALAWPTPSRGGRLLWHTRAQADCLTYFQCPDLGLHLAGTKKVQQVLAAADELRKFLSEEDHVARVLACTAGQWSMDPAERTDEIVCAMFTRAGAVLLQGIGRLCRLQHSLRC